MREIIWIEKAYLHQTSSLLIENISIFILWSFERNRLYSEGWPTSQSSSSTDPPGSSRSCHIQLLNMSSWATVWSYCCQPIWMRFFSYTRSFQWIYIALHTLDKTILNHGCSCRYKMSFRLIGKTFFQGTNRIMPNPFLHQPNWKWSHMHRLNTWCHIEEQRQV